MYMTVLRKHLRVRIVTHLIVTRTNKESAEFLITGVKN
jgi:hypothetical protein